MALKRKSKGYALFGNHDSIASLERWLTRHPGISDVEAFSHRGKKYTWKDILSEIRCRRQSEKAMEQMVNQFYLYKYAENKE